MDDLISRQAVQEMIDRIGGMFPYRQIGNRESYSQYNEAWTDAISRVDAELNSLPSAEPEKRTDKRTETHSCDLIDRQSAIEALGEGAMVNYQAAGHDNGLIKAIDVIKGLPPAQPEISLLTVKVAPGLEELERTVRRIKDASVVVLPPAEPERKKGRWIRNDNGTYSCSVCQSWIPEEQHHYARYCLYCGADMRGETDED